MTVVQTVLIYVLIPAALYGVIALLTLWPGFVRAPRYRSGQPWTYEPVWWSAGSVLDAGAEQAEQEPSGARTARGGARGNW